MDDFIMKPLMNHLFTRDTPRAGFMVYRLTNGKTARQRETNNLRAIYRWHSNRRRRIYLIFPATRILIGDHATVRKAMMLVIGRGLLIGMSERSRPRNRVLPGIV